METKKPLAASRSRPVVAAMEIFSWLARRRFRPACRSRFPVIARAIEPNKSCGNAINPRRLFRQRRFCRGLVRSMHQRSMIAMLSVPNLATTPTKSVNPSIAQLLNLTH